ncbi:MAG: YlmC/YmxH family sporulation protein [Clostridia bacterium]|nr:YlmC/YmxH family sporulation protein [Clostridia bacterium]
METSFVELKQKEVVNLCDGKRLGRVCDVVFTWPEGRVQGIVVPGSRGFRFGRGDLFIDLKDVTKIGVDVVLVDIKTAPKPDKGKERCRIENRPPPKDRRDYGEYE